jgi:hypothetical protein
MGATQRLTIDADPMASFGEHFKLCSRCLLHYHLRRTDQMGQVTTLRCIGDKPAGIHSSCDEKALLSRDEFLVGDHPSLWELPTTCHFAFLDSVRIKAMTSSTCLSVKTPPQVGI